MKMVKSLWASLLFLGTVLHFASPIFGQLSPELDKFWQTKSLDKRGLESVRNLFAEHGLTFEEGVELLSDKKKVFKLVREKFTELVDGATIIQNESGDRFYRFNEEDQQRLVSEICIDHIRLFLRDLIFNEYYARRMAASSGGFPTEEAEFTFNARDYGFPWLCRSTKANLTSGVPPFDGKSCYADIPYTVSCASCMLSDVWIIIGQTTPFLYLDCVDPAPWLTSEIAFTTLLAFFALLVGIGTFYDVFLKAFVLEKMSQKKKEKDTPVAQKENIYEDPDRSDGDSAIATSSLGDGEETKKRCWVDTSEGAGEINEGFEKGVEGPTDVDKAALRLEFSERQPQGPKKKTYTHIGWAILHGVLMSFSIYNNLGKLLSAKKTPNTMAVLNGLRVLSMFWVILGHSCQFVLGFVSNASQYYAMAGNMGFLAILNGTYSVDTFFVLSGFLVTYLTLKQIDSKKLNSVLSWCLFYFHRWWRLTPVYMVAMGIWALLMPHFGQGFLKEGLGDFVKSFCRRYWWTHLLYFNNLLPFPGSVDESCMGWSWYLANDMQFFIISPLILVILHKNAKAGMALIISLLVVSLSALFGLNYYYGFSINGQESYTGRPLEPSNADITYAKPYTRIPTYLVGMVVGYVMFRLKDKKDFKLNKVVACVGWVLALGTMFGVIYGVHWAQGRYSPFAEALIYLTFSRLAWGVAVGWVIFACLVGAGGPIGEFLGWSFWVPMARLSYAAYLIHPVLMTNNVYTTQFLYNMTYVTIAYHFIGNVVVSYTAALVLSLLIEGPTLGLEKVMFGRFK
ncbi:O-acyltransferase like protein-like [Diadema antillarum]|uniref:O-acyltransferase like protein-like n=1 Tax=Diadema antillarum TaxID=105358 RepID=UPI003A87487E